MPPLKFALDELIYTISGWGIATVWTEGVPKHSFEFGPRSLFLIPRGCHRQFANARGDQTLRLLHNNYLPVAMSLEPDPGFYFTNAHPHPKAIRHREVGHDVGRQDRDPHRRLQMGHWPRSTRVRATDAPGLRRHIGGRQHGAEG